MFSLQLLLLENNNNNNNKILFSRVKIKDHYTRLHNHLQMLAIKVCRLVSQSPSFLHMQYPESNSQRCGARFIVPLAKLTAFYN